LRSMGKGALSNLGVFLSVILVLAAGAILGVLQVRWARVATHAEEQRLRISMERGAMQAAGHAVEEIRVVHSLTRLSRADFTAQDWSVMESQLHFWYANARFPDLLLGLYVIRRLPAMGVLSYSPSRGRLLPSALPSDLLAVIPSFAAMRDIPLSGSSRSLPGMRRVVILPLYAAASTSEGRSEPPTAAVLILLDTKVLYTEVLPHYVASDMGDYFYRVIDAGTGEVLAQSEGLPAARTPEVSVGLSSDNSPANVAAVAMGQDASEGAGIPGPVPQWGSSSVDPLLQSWLLRAQGAPGISDAPPPSSSARGDEATLQIFYPKGSLDSTLRIRQGLDVGVSLGILALLLVSVFVLSSLYRRSNRLRTSEQEFVASISHELRTPIAVIQATSENLRRGVVSDPARLPRYAEVIHGQIKRLSGMVENILLYSGLQSSWVRAPSLTAIDLPALVQDIALPLQYLALERSSTLRLDLDGLPAACCSDRMALRGIIENLGMNAIRHASPGEIVLSIGRPSADCLRIAVEDRGPGIPAREQRRVFEPFVRGERSARAQKPGSGLGLHLVKRMVALLGGRITLESPYADGHHAAQKGCRFTVIIPFQETCNGA
jgi:signal transduction histidine kinase